MKELYIQESFYLQIAPQTIIVTVTQTIVTVTKTIVTVTQTNVTVTRN